MKEPLLLLHNALGSSKQFGAVEQQLGEMFKVYTLNFEGHGGLPSSTPFSIHRFVDNVITFLETRNIAKTNIFGYSMGGYVALQLALEAPEKVQKISTLGTKFEWNTVSAAKEVNMLQPRVIEEKVPRFAQQLQQEHHPQDWKELMHKTANMMLAMGEGNTLSEADFKCIQHDVTIGVGNLDAMVSTVVSKHVASLIPNAAFVQLNEVPHPITKINSDVLIDYITTTLQ